MIIKKTTSRLSTLSNYFLVAAILFAVFPILNIIMALFSFVGVMPPAISLLPNLAYHWYLIIDGLARLLSFICLVIGVWSSLSEIVKLKLTSNGIIKGSIKGIDLIGNLATNKDSHGQIDMVASYEIAVKEIEPEKFKTKRVLISIEFEEKSAPVLKLDSWHALVKNTVKSASSCL